MKTEKSLLSTFLINTLFSVTEFIGGAVTGSVAIISDAIHDFGDCLTLGIAYFFEHKNHSSNKKSAVDYSAIGALITTIILIVGSIIIIFESVEKISSGKTEELKTGAMLVFAIIGMIMNIISVYLTRGRHNANERAINLHLIGDVLSNFIILVGAIVIELTGITIIDPIMSIGVAIFIMVLAIKNIVSSDII